MSDTLADIARVCASSLSLDEVLGPVLRLMAQSGLERATLTRRGRGDVLVLEAGHGLTPAELRRLQYRVGRGITGRVVETGAAESIPNVAEEPRFEDHLGIRQRYEKASFTCVPVRHDGDIVGALSAFRIGGHAPRDLARLEVVAGLLAAQVVRVGTAAPEPSRGGLSGCCRYFQAVTFTGLIPIPSKNSALARMSHRRAIRADFRSCR